MELGSLFDGSGGFPLAGTLCGIEPVWASEIEPYPIKVTKKNLPGMMHLGDITKINGAEIEPVDVITFGSPCQDLSVAGKRAGLDGERSGLFKEAIRIIKEMRAATNGEHPTFIVWENVPGAFSSNGGEDFRTVLQEIAGVATNEHVISRPANGWTNAGAIMGGEFSIAWRVLDAQYWGVPQRRKRIFLVADFRGERAGEILFERDGLQRNITQGKEAGKGTAKGVGGFIEEAECYPINTQVISRHNALGRGTGFGLGENGAPAYTLQAGHEHGVCAGFKGGQGTGQIGWQEECAATLGANMSHNEPTVCIAGNTIDRQIQNGGNGVGAQEDISYTLNTVDRHAVCFGNTGYAKYKEKEFAQALKASGGDYAGGSETLMCMAHGQANAEITEDVSPTLNCNHEQPIIGTHTVRRLTPLECCRLQGFPDWWCEGVEGSDSAQYKMWGNGIALPCALYVLEGIADIERKERGRG